MNKPTLDALRDIANSYCKGEEIQRVLLEEVLERFICLADEKLTSSEYVSREPIAWLMDDGHVMLTVYQKPTGEGWVPLYTHPNSSSDG